MAPVRRQAEELPYLNDAPRRQGIRSSGTTLWAVNIKLRLHAQLPNPTPLRQPPSSLPDTSGFPAPTQEICWVTSRYSQVDLTLCSTHRWVPSTKHGTQN